MVRYKTVLRPGLIADRVRDFELEWADGLMEDCGGDKFQEDITQAFLDDLPHLLQLIACGKQGGKGFDYFDFRQMVLTAARVARKHFAKRESTS